MISPSRSRTCLFAYAAISSSCVITTIVRPAALSRLNIAIISSLVTRVEAPVGSSARTSAGRVDDRARDRDALLLAARELVGHVRGAVGEPDRVERLGRQLPALLRLDSRVEERQLDVRLRGRAGNEVEGLEDEADLAAADLATARPRRAFARRSPSRKYWPRVGTSRQPMMCISVDFPEPDAPMIATKSPRETESDTPRSACTSIVAERVGLDDPPQGEDQVPLADPGAR